MSEPPLTDDAIEKLNNAIAQIDFACEMDPTMPKGSKKAVHAMRVHWRAFWYSTERAVMPNSVLRPKLERYVKWYTRSWAISPPSVQAQVVRPDQIDVSWQALALASLKNWNDGAKEALDNGISLATYVAKGAAELADKAQKNARGALSDIAVIGVVGVIGFYFLTRR